MRAVLVHLDAGDKRAIEGMVDERVDDMQAGMKLAHELPEGGIDRGFDRAGGQFDAARQEVPDFAVLHVEADDRALATRPAQETAIGQLPSASRVERACAQEQPSRRRGQDRARKRQRVGVVEAEIATHAEDILGLASLDENRIAVSVGPVSRREWPSCARRYWL